MGNETINDFQNTEPEISVAVLRKRKEHVERRLHGFQFRIWILITTAVAGGLLGYALITIIKSENREDSSSLASILPYSILGAFFGSFIYFYFTLLMRTSIQARLRSIDSKLAQLGADELKENIEENFFTKLVQINFKYLDQYYLQTQEQAEKSFRLSSFASISGLIIIAVGIFMMYTGKTQPAYVTTGAGIISQFISAIFFYLYNRTILKMSQYHQKLVITQNISLALKMTDEMSKDEKDKSLTLLIDRLTLDVNKHLTNDRE